jgi:hypothetical protein
VALGISLLFLHDFSCHLSCAAHMLVLWNLHVLTVVLACIVVVGRVIDASQFVNSMWCSDSGTERVKQK